MREWNRRRIAKVHELTSLALFASGEYRAAATEAHAALALGAPSDWTHLYAYYNDADRYTGQLRKLEKTVADVPNSAPGHFLLGYHYLMTGAKDEAKEHFAQAAKLTPNDKLAQHILKQLESGGAVTPPDSAQAARRTKGQAAIAYGFRSGTSRLPPSGVRISSITPLESEWSFIACLNSAAERTAFLSTCMTSMPPRMPAWAARPLGSTSLIERSLESLIVESLDIGLRKVRDLDPQVIDR